MPAAGDDLTRFLRFAGPFEGFATQATNDEPNQALSLFGKITEKEEPVRNRVSGLMGDSVAMDGRVIDNG